MATGPFARSVVSSGITTSLSQRIARCVVPRSDAFGRIFPGRRRAAWRRLYTLRVNRSVLESTLQTYTSQTHLRERGRLSGGRHLLTTHSIYLMCTLSRSARQLLYTDLTHDENFS